MVWTLLEVRRDPAGDPSGRGAGPMVRVVAATVIDGQPLLVQWDRAAGVGPWTVTAVGIGLTDVVVNMPVPPVREYARADGSFLATPDHNAKPEAVRDTIRDALTEGILRHCMVPADEPTEEGG